MNALSNLLYDGWRVEIVNVGALVSITLRHVSWGTYNVTHENLDTALRLAEAGECRRIGD